MDATTGLDDLLKQAQRAVRTGEAEQAIPLFQKALQHDERRIDAYEGLAAAHFHLARYSEAAASFQQIARLRPTDGRCLINLGVIYNRQGEFQKAADVIRKGLGKETRCAQGFLNLGIAYRGLNQPSMAVSAYREAVRLDPRLAEAHLGLANLYAEMQNHQQAILHYKQVLEISPNAERARRGLAQAETAVASARQAVSPFGRLVDETFVRAKAAPQVEKQLSEADRQNDRRTIQKLCAEIETAADAWRAQLKGEVEPKLLALGRIVSQESESTHHLAKAHRDYRAALTASAELRRLLRRKLIELRAHEELMNTPDLHPQAEAPADQ